MTYSIDAALGAQRRLPTQLAVLGAESEGGQAGQGAAAMRRAFETVRDSQALPPMQTGPGFSKLEPVIQQKLVEVLQRNFNEAEFAAELRLLAEDGGPYEALALGSEGPAVSELRTALARLGFLSEGSGSTFDSATQAALRAFQRSRQLVDDGVARADTLSELHQRRFSVLPRQAQELLIEQLAKHASDSATRALLSKVALSGGFRLASASQQDRWLQLYGGLNELYSKPLRDATRVEVKWGRFQKLKPEEQRAWLEKNMVRSVPDGLIGGASPLAPRPSASFSISKPIPAWAYPFAAGRASARRYELRFGSQVILMYEPDKVPPSKLNRMSLEELAQNLAALPLSVRRLIRVVTLEPAPYPEDGERAKESGKRVVAFMTASNDGVVNVYPSEHRHNPYAVQSSLIHEAGHVLSLRAWSPVVGRSDWLAWDAARAADGLEVSDYAMTNNREDFSESFEVYHHVLNTPHEAEIRGLFPARFALIDALMEDAESRREPPRSY